MVDGTQNDDDSNNEEESQLLFSCQCDSARTVADLLSCLRRVVTSNVSSSTWSEFGGASSGGGGGGGGHGATQRTSHTQSTAAAVAMAGGSANKIQHATVYAGPNGLTFHVQHGLAKQSQCSVDLPKGLFREYFVGEEEVWLEDSDVESVSNNHAGGTSASQSQGRTKEIIHGGEFGVNLTTVLECFSVLSRNNKSTQSMAKGKGSNGSSSGGTKQNYGEYASLDRVPLCMSYDRATALFHLEFLEGGQLGGNGDATNMGGGCLVTCEVPGVAVSDDVDDGPDDEMDNHNSLSSNNTSGLAAAFRSSPLLSRAILYSDALQAAVAELYDVPGASVVQVTLSNEGIELGTVGPRSEVWVNVPYHKRQTGMYVGMECNKSNNNDPFGTQSSPSMSRKYPLGAFLTGMRGLDIGCETCISVNSRGMMAIQHQVAKDGYTDTLSSNVRPSFVDFIMTCIEDEGDDEEGLSQENISQGVHQHDAFQNEMNDQTEETTTATTRTKTRTRETFSSSEDEEMQSRANGRKPKQHYDSASGTDDEGNERSSSSNAASKILGELELDKDMLSSRRDDSVQGRKTALEDIRRRRRERQNEPIRMDESDANESAEDENAEGRNDSTNKRRSGSEHKSAASRKMRRSEDNNSESNQSDDNTSNQLRNLRSTAQSSSDDDDGEDDSEPLDALDVTAEIPTLFSKSPSMSTSRHGRHRGKSTDRDDEAVDEEPKMMYGDTRLEFTQDGYESGDS